MSEVNAEKVMFDSVKMFMGFTVLQKTQFLRMKFQRDSSKIQSTYYSIQDLKARLQETQDEVSRLEQTERTLAKCSGAGSTPNDAKLLNATREVISAILARNKLHITDLEGFLGHESETWNDLVVLRRSDENAFGNWFTKLYGVCQDHPDNMWFVWDSKIGTESVCVGCDCEKMHLHWKKQADEMAAERKLPQSKTTLVDEPSTGFTSYNIHLTVLEKNE